MDRLFTLKRPAPDYQAELRAGFQAYPEQLANYQRYQDQAAGHG